MPDTFILDFEEDIVKLKRFSKNQSFILKSQFHKRQGLKIVKGIKELLEEKDSFQIAQPLIEDLYTYKGVSFNFRAYLLLCLSKNKLEGYLYYDANCIYAIASSQEKDLYRTRVTQGSNPVPVGYPYLMSQLLEMENIDYGTFFGELAQKVNLLLQSAKSDFGQMKHLEKANCFQVLGVDVLVDKNKKPIICEVNKGPELDAKNVASGVLKSNMLNDVFSVVGLNSENNEGYFKVFEEEL